MDVYVGPNKNKKMCAVDRTVDRTDHGNTLITLEDKRFISIHIVFRLTLQNITHSQYLHQEYTAVSTGADEPHVALGELGSYSPH